MTAMLVHRRKLLLAGVAAAWGWALAAPAGACDVPVFRYALERWAPSAYDVVVILKKSGQEISGCSVELKAERADTDPKIFTRIHMHFVLRGRNLKTSMVESAIKLSHQKYCSASIMLGKTAEITHDYEIVAE